MAGTLVAMAVAACLSGTAFGQGQAPDFRMIWDVSGDTSGPVDYSWGDVGGAPGGFGSLNGYGDWSLPGNEGIWSGWSYSGTLDGSSVGGGSWELQWTTVFGQTDTGAFVVTNIVVTNNDPLMQTFDSEMVLPLGLPFLTPTMRGSISGNLTELTFDDAMVAAPIGSRIYAPRIDGLDEQAGYLMTDPFSVTAGFLEQIPVGPQDFGLPVPIVASQDADTNISILLSFDLSGGDSVGLNAVFEIIAIPGPGGIGLLAALGVIARRRRRR
jgi:hypothetical protein